MNWGILTSIFLLGTFKFMFSGIPGAIAQIPEWQTIVASGLGGMVSATIFYTASEFFIHRSFKKFKEKELLAIQNGTPRKRKFTRMNKLIVMIKRSLGIYGICLFAPLLLSVPIGTMIATKFYGKSKKTLPLILIGLAIHSFWLSMLFYALY